MKIIYLILLVLILYTGFVYGKFRYILAHADLPEIRQVDRTVGTGPKLRYIAAGDSATVGVGASSAEKSFPYLLTDYLANKNQVEYHNVGVIGARTQDLINKQLSAIVDYHPDIVTISIGANDVTHSEKKEQIIENYKKIIQDLTDKTSAKIYITDVPRFDYDYLFPLPLRRYFDSQAKSINVELLKLETERVKIVDIHKVQISSSADQFHPSDQGYQYWADLFRTEIQGDF